MERFENAKDLFKWMASDELSKEDILEMLTENMCAELIVKNNDPYLESNGDKYDYHYDGGIVGSFKAPKMDRDRMEILLYNAITYIEDQGISGFVWMPELGITDEEYSAIVDNAVFTYRVSFVCMIGDNEEEVDLSWVGEEAKPTLQQEADEIRHVLSTLCQEDELIRAIDTIDFLELTVERNGEYFDRDEADEDIIAEVINLAKAPLLKPSLERQMSQAAAKQQTTVAAEKSAVEKDAVKEDLTL